jgi:hypothetical protein
MPLRFSVSPSSGERVFLAELPAATAAKKPKRTYNRYDDGTTVTKKKRLAPHCLKYNYWVSRRVSVQKLLKYIC